MRSLLAELIGAWQAGDADRAAALFAPDATFGEAGRPALAGRGAIAAHFTAFFAHTGAFRFDVDETIVEDDRAAIRYRFTLFERDGTPHERLGCALASSRDGFVHAWQEYAR